MNHFTLIYIYLVLAAIITHLPVVGIYFALANTLIHEISHLLFGLLTGGKAHKMNLNPDASGLATTSSSSWLGRVIVSYAGYTGASAAAIGLFFLMSKGYYDYIIYFFIGIATVTLIFWVRNLYGFLWTCSFIGILGFLVYKHYETIMLHVSIFLTAIVLVQSISTAFTILKLSIINRKDAGDATSLAKATFIPSVVWGLLFFAQSLWAGYFIFIHFIH